MALRWAARSSPGEGGIGVQSMDANFFAYVVGFGIVVLAALILFAGPWFIVGQQEVAIVERLGRFNRTARAGLNFKVPLLERVAYGGVVDLRVRQLVTKTVTKTKDNVILQVVTNVQFKINEAQAQAWYYSMDKREEQVSAFVENTVRAHAPKMTLDDVYEKKDELAGEIASELAAEVGKFGFLVQKALVTDVIPDARVAQAMNDINAAQREAVAANARGDANRTIIIKQAEAEKAALILKAEAEKQQMQLHGEGIAAERIAIANGMREAATQLQESLGDVSGEEVVTVLLSQQYLDSLVKMADASGSSTIFMNQAPGGARDMKAEVLAALRAGGSGPGNAPPAKRKPAASTGLAGKTTEERLADS